MTRTFSNSSMSAWLLASMLACTGSSQAQSAYTMTRLDTTLFQSALLAEASFFIDTKNRVYSSSQYYQGFSFNTGGLMLLTVPVYKPFLVQWAVPASGTSVASTKVSNESVSINSASPDGSKIIVARVNDYSGSWLDRTTNTFQSAYPRLEVNFLSLNLAAINSAGRLAINHVVPTPEYSSFDANHAAAYFRALSWVPGQSPLTLSAGPQFLGASAAAITEAGTVVGAVYGAESAMDTHAARWVNGVLEVLDNRPGLGSTALDANDAGQVLVRGWEPKVDEQAFNYKAVLQTNPTFGVIQNGVLKPIVSNQVGYTVVEARAINASGTVIGTLAPLNAAPVFPYISPNSVNKSRRAFIWKNGTMTDLTTLVTSKGVKLPAGVVLNKGVDINDQGSVVAGYTLQKQDGTLQAATFVRLLAKP